MDLAGQQIFQFLSHYGYWIMVPLMIVEGPVITIVSAMLAKLGAFNAVIVFVFSVAGDMIGDMILYWLGYAFGMSFVNKVGRYIGITENLVLRMKSYFEKHGGTTVFSVKATTGLCWATFTAAGIVRMDFKKFLKYSFLGGLVWSGFLVAMGYFYGYMWKELRQYISQAGWIIASLALISFVGVQIYKRKQSKKIIGNDLK
ncbi:MAG: DedA family protein [bacterium]|nr:DedA family protein [bacterium]